MKHIIHFCVDEDEASDVLETVVRAYGFENHEAYVNEFIEKPIVEVSAEDDGLDEEDDEIPDAGPWDKELAVDYLDQLTDDAVKAIALLISSGTTSGGAGVVTIRDMRFYLRVDSLRGTFSTMGAAARNTPDLDPTARPFFKVTRPVRSYVMNADVLKIFKEALEEHELGYMIKEADSYFAALERKGRRK